MPRAIVLHPGFHKTGTSTIQAFLRRNRKALMPHMAIRLKGQMQELMHATRGYSTWRDPISLSKAERRFDAVLADLPDMPRRVLCLSAEELCGHMPGRGELLSYAAAPVLLTRFVQQLRDRFPQAPVAIYLGTRHPESWQRSAWGEHIKSSGLTLDFEAFCEKYPCAPHLGACVDEITNSVPCPVYAQPIEACADMPLGPVTPLLELCDVPAALQATFTPEPRQNTALDVATLDALLQANRSYPDADTRNAAKAAILAKAQTP